MGKYAKTIVCVQRVAPFLDAILLYKDRQSFRLKADGDAGKLAFQLREAFSYLRHMEKEGLHSFHLGIYEKYKELPHLFLFRQRNEFIMCERRVTSASIDLFADDEEEEEIAQHVAKEPRDIFTTIGYVMEHKNITAIHFPNLTVSGMELLKIQKWCKLNDRWLVPQKEGVLITKDNPDAVTLMEVARK